MAEPCAAPIRRMRPLLGTFVEVGVSDAAPYRAEAAIDAAFAALGKAQARWSFHDPDSELSRLNREPGRAVPLSRPTTRLLRLARALMRASAGAFDCTVGGRLVAEGHLPDHGGPAPLAHGEAGDLLVHASTAMLRRPVRLTLDGIAKGFAVDLAVEAMRRCGARAGWVNAGGDMRAFGDVTVPVLRREAGPAAPAEGAMALLGGLRDMAVATSQVLDEAAAAQAALPARIVAPHGAAAAHGVWTVLARSAWRADALTKVAACTAPERRAPLLQRLGGTLLEVRP